MRVNGLDEVNCSIPIDNKMARFWMRLQPHMNVFTLKDDPEEPSGNIKLPKPVIATMNNWMSRPAGEPDPVKLERMKMHFG